MLFKGSWEYCTYTMYQFWVSENINENSTMGKLVVIKNVYVKIPHLNDWRFVLKQLIL